MRRNILNLLLPILFLLPIFLSAQQNWYICEGVDKNEAEPKDWEALVIDRSGPDKKDYYIDIDALVKYPSCPLATDGFIEILSVSTRDKYSNQFVSNEFNAQFAFVIQSENAFTTRKSNKITDLGTSIIHMIISIGNKQASYTPFEFPPTRYYKDEIMLIDAMNESCPGAMDGFASLAVFRNEIQVFTDLKFPDDYIDWDNGFIGPMRFDLPAGVNRFQRKYTYEKNLCCLDGSVTINSNGCYSALLEDSFASQVPGSWFINPPGSFKNENNVGVFKDDGCVFIPFNLESQDKAVSLRMNITGEADISIIDMQMNPLASKSIMGDGSVYTLSLNESMIKGFYLKVAGKSGTMIDDLSLFRFEQEIMMISASFKPEEPDSRSAVTETVCVGNQFAPSFGLNIEGGISPLSYQWELNEDGLYNDAEGLDYLHQFDAAGNYSLSLLISDAIGQSTTVDLDYEAVVSDDLTIAVPELDLAGDAVYGFTVCDDAQPFSLMTRSGEGLLSSSSDGFDNGVFDPAVAGVGEHIIEATGDACDQASVLFINVIKEETVEFEDLSVIYQCQEFIDLDALLTEDIAGIWFVNDTLAILSDTLIPAYLDAGMMRLSFEAGADFCNPSQSVDIEVQEAPIAELTSASMDILTDASAFDLNDILTPESSQDGIWSGPNIVDDRYFDPQGLAPGVYTVLYTLGEGACQTELQFLINLIMSTSLEDITDDRSFDVFPNPVVDQLTLCIENMSHTKQLIARIYDLDGRLVLKQAVNSECTVLDFDELAGGVYLLYLIGPNSTSFGMQRIVKM